MNLTVTSVYAQTTDAEDGVSWGSFYHNLQDAVVSGPSRYILILAGGAGRSRLTNVAT